MIDNTATLRELENAGANLDEVRLKSDVWLISHPEIDEDGNELWPYLRTTWIDEDGVEHGDWTYNNEETWWFVTEDEAQRIRIELPQFLPQFDISRLRHWLALRAQSALPRLRLADFPATQARAFGRRLIAR